MSIFGKKVSCEVLFTPFSSKIRKTPQPDRSQKEISRQLKEALESVIIIDKYPKAQIDVYISVIEIGGSLLSTCLTAAGLALCHASIDVYDLVVGADLIWKEGIAFVSPTLHEEECLKVMRLEGKIGEGSLSLGMMPQFAKSQIVLMVQEGDLLVDNLTEGISLAINSCQRIYKLAKQTLLNHVETAIEEEKDS
ncbi:Exosome complex component Rrp41 [Armadillidium nasatum]|uniref:Exosome complex component Rrp41 n=1 Tax=Armadillidium nasatum TaxID=96803 RepID=A0A5N5SSZ3_9CRUS|nr:Exosome complex component Rrp41 [Armadillidium nasatum]